MRRKQHQQVHIKERLIISVQLVARLTLTVSPRSMLMSQANQGMDALIRLNRNDRKLEMNAKTISQTARNQVKEKK